MLLICFHKDIYNTELNEIDYLSHITFEEWNGGPDSFDLIVLRADPFITILKRAEGGERIGL